MSEIAEKSIVSDWILTTLGEVASCTLGGTPSTDVPHFWIGDIPWMASGDVNLRRVYDVPGRITAAGLAASNARLVTPPAVAVGLAGQGKTRGTVALILCELSTNQSIALLRGEDGLLQTEYLFHNLDQRYEELRARSSGGGRGGLSKGILDAVPIELPPWGEQRIISGVLGTLDTTIRRTEELIAKLKQVKQGLLHDLLTRGIDANGELRPPQSQAPHLYKQSPLGWIPKEWDFLPVSSVAEIIYGISDAIEMNLKDGIKTITLPCVSASGDLSLAPEKIVFTAPRKVPRSLLLQRGDLLFNWRNGSLNHLGKTAYFDADVTYTHVGFLLRVRAKAETCSPQFLCAVLRYAKDSGIFLRAKGQVNNTFNSDELRSLRLAFPGAMEQSLICAQLDALECSAEVERKALRKKLVQKSGLMDDLLTGRVRVTPLLDATTTP